MDVAPDWPALAAAAAVDPAWLEDAFALLRIPSVSASEEHAADVLRCAEWLRDYIVAGGGSAELVPTRRQPLVVGRIAATAADPATAPTVLLYGHFDVQPTGDLALWDSPPFAPEIRDGWIYARGATDDKIHLFVLLRAALDLAAEGALPVNVRIVGDGEEEHIGDTVVDWCRADAEPTDFALVFDGMVLRHGQGVSTVSTRGLAFWSVEVETGTSDLHSGVFGGVGLNAVHVLMEMLAAVVGVPDELAAGAVVVSDEQAAVWDRADDWGRLLAEAGGRPLSADALADFNRRTGYRPSVDVHGIVAGEAELDATIIPVRARAHVSLRLAPGQRGDVVCPIFERLLRDAAHPAATVRIDRHAVNHGSRTDPDAPALRTLEAVLERVTGEPPLTLPWGASIPFLAALDERGIPNALTGFGLPDSAIHAPNERFPVAYLATAMQTIRELLVALGEEGRHPR